MTKTITGADPRAGLGRGYAAVGLVNPKTNINVGSVLRAAHAFEAAMVVVQGARYHKAVTDVSWAHRKLPLLHGDVLDLIPHDCVPVAVELYDGAQDIVDYVHPERAFYVFGPEDGSVPKHVVAGCRDVIYVPSSICLNLAAVVNVVLYDRRAKQGRAA